MTVAHDSVSEDHLAKIQSLLQSIQTKPSIRIVKFKTQAGKRSDPSPLFPSELTVAFNLIRPPQLPGSSDRIQGPL
jgi:hypothetical protein